MDCIMIMTILMVFSGLTGKVSLEQVMSSCLNSTVDARVCCQCTAQPALYLCPGNCSQGFYPVTVNVTQCTKTYMFGDITVTVKHVVDSLLNAQFRACARCDPACVNCTDGGPENCVQCEEGYTSHINADNTTMTCARQDENKLLTIILAVSCSVAVLAICVIVVFVVWRKIKNKVKRNFNWALAECVLPLGQHPQAYYKGLIGNSIVCHQQHSSVDDNPQNMRVRHPTFHRSKRIKSERSEQFPAEERPFTTKYLEPYVCPVDSMDTQGELYVSENRPQCRDVSITFEGIERMFQSRSCMSERSLTGSESSGTDRPETITVHTVVQPAKPNSSFCSAYKKEEFTSLHAEHSDHSPVPRRGTIPSHSSNFTADEHSPGSLEAEWYTLTVDNHSIADQDEVSEVKDFCLKLSHASSRQKSPPPHLDINKDSDTGHSSTAMGDRHTYENRPLSLSACQTSAERVVKSAEHNPSANAFEDNSEWYVDYVNRAYVSLFCTHQGDTDESENISFSSESSLNEKISIASLTSCTQTLFVENASDFSYDSDQRCETMDEHVYSDINDIESLVKSNGLDLTKYYTTETANLHYSNLTSASTQTSEDTPVYANLPLSIFSPCWQGSAEFSSAGGVLTTDVSDVRLEIPAGAIDRGSFVVIKAAISTDLGQAHRILNLPDDEVIMSPIAEYHAEGHDVQFQKPVSIVLPHFLPPEFSEEFINVYGISGHAGIICYQRLHLERRSNVDIDAHSTDRDEFFVASDKTICVRVNHFSAYCCTYCKKKLPPPVLFVRLYAKHVEKLEGGRLVKVRLQVWDSRMQIRDFGEQYKEKCINDEHMQLVDRLFQLQALDRKQKKCVGVGMCLSEEDKQFWMHSRRKNGEILRPEEKIISLCDLMTCGCDQRMPLMEEWGLDNKKDLTPPDVFQCVVDVGYVMLESVDYTTANHARGKHESRWKPLDFLDKPKHVTIDVRVKKCMEFQDRTYNDGDNRLPGSMLVNDLKKPPESAASSDSETSTEKGTSGRSQRKKRLRKKQTKNVNPGRSHSVTSHDSSDSETTLKTPKPLTRAGTETRNQDESELEGAVGGEPEPLRNNHPQVYIEKVIGTLHVFANGVHEDTTNGGNPPNSSQTAAPTGQMNGHRQTEAPPAWEREVRRETAIPLRNPIPVSDSVQSHNIEHNETEV